MTVADCTEWVGAYSPTAAAAAAVLRDCRAVTCLALPVQRATPRTPKRQQPTDVCLIPSRRTCQAPSVRTRPRHTGQLACIRLLTIIDSHQYNSVSSNSSGSNNSYCSRYAVDTDKWRHGLRYQLSHVLIVARSNDDARTAVNIDFH